MKKETDLPEEKKQAIVPEIIKDLYQKPFHYDQREGKILDNRGYPVIEIRGKGWIFDSFGSEFDGEHAMDKMGQYVSDLLNANYHWKN